MDSDINYIIQKSVNGDKEFQEILLKKLHPLIYKNIYRYYSVGDDIIEDLVQEGYIIILQSLKNFDENRNVHFLGYVKIKLDFYYKNYYRNTKNQRNTVSLNQKLGDTDSSIELENIIIDEKFNLEDNFFKKEEISELLTNIKKLSRKEQDILNLYYKNELTMKEISNRLNIAYRTAIGRKYTAIIKLKNLMRVNIAGGENDG